MRSMCSDVGRLLALMAIVLVSGESRVHAGNDDVIVGEFATGNLTGWKEKIFEGNTLYELVKSGAGMALKADSRGTASGLVREMAVDLMKTPCLTWSWKVDRILDGLDETTRSGDDFPARVYVIFSEGPLFWKSRTLSYVWSSGRPQGSSWPNAYSDKAVIIAAQGGSKKVGQWVRQSRNIRADYQRLIGGDIGQADGVAIMTDTDDSGQTATAYYQDIRFTSSC